MIKRSLMIICVTYGINFCNKGRFNPDCIHLGSTYEDMILQCKAEPKTKDVIDGKVISAKYYCDAFDRVCNVFIEFTEGKISWYRISNMKDSKEYGTRF